jgi:hypothetical protein
MSNLRRLGVYGANLPTKKSASVRPSDFGIAGLIGLFERKYDRSFEASTPEKLREIFGDNISSAWFGSDAAIGFFQNAVGVDARLIVKSHVGFDGSAIDATVASATLTDSNGAVSLFTLIRDLLLRYDAHEGDAELPAGWAYHAAQESANHSVPTTVPTDVTEAIDTLNALKAAYNAHDNDPTAHGAQGVHQVSAADATSVATAITLANAIKAAYNLHRADATEHTTAPDAVNVVTVSDASGSPVSTVKFSSAYKTEPDYGQSGNRTGYTVEHGSRFSSTLLLGATGSDTYLTLNAVSGIRAGDIIVVNCTVGSPAAPIQRKVTLVDEANRRVHFTTPFGGTGTVGDEVAVPGFRLRTWRKSISGIVSEVEEDLGKVFCTMEPEVTDYYVQNVHSTNKWLKADDQASASTGVESFPGAVPAVSYLAAGSDGTAPTIAAHWSRDVAKLVNDPIRMVANCETTNEDIQKSLETAMKGRTDNPKVIFNVPEDRDKDQLITIGNRFQRSDDVLGVIAAHWLEITDPFSTSPIAPPREVPNVGHVMGLWVRSIGTKGIHQVPALKDMPLYGVVGVVGDQFLDDNDRTDLAEAGVNVIQYVKGYGYIVRNFFTPSTSKEFLFANGILMREFIKVSAVDSLQGSENTPNSFNRVKEDKSAILNFLYTLWNVGSTGQVPPGETFGQVIASDGSATRVEEHFEVTADAVNNPASSLQAGERNLDVYFTYPAPAGSIKIGVGIMLK